MNKLIPIITEKSTQLAKGGKYTFRVDKNMGKYQIAKLVEEVFGVHVVNIRTQKVAGEIRRTVSGRKRIVLPSKKAIVTLKEKESIDLFEEAKK